MVKIGRWGEPYSEPGNPFPDETESFAQMPTSCPLHILPYGILSEKILPLIKVKRRENREQRKEFLIKKTLNVNLIMCFEELYRLSQLDPCNSILHRRVNTSATKQTMKKLVDECDIPLIYLEEAYQKQLQGPPKLEVGDWVKCVAWPPATCSFAGQPCDDVWGVVNRVLGKKNLLVSMVKTHICPYGKNYPLFHRWQRDWMEHRIKKQVSIWKCEKVGHDTREWIHLRKKMIADYNKSLTRRQSVWDDILEPVIQMVTSAATMPRGYKTIWFTMAINVLDKEVWKSITDTKMDNSYVVRHNLWWCFRGDAHRRPLPPTRRLLLTSLRDIVLGEGILD